MDIRVKLSVAFMLLSTHAENCVEEQRCSNCSNTTGYCITDCFPGYFGLKCKSPCSINCINSECSLTQHGIHECSDGCVVGFYGSQCNIPCTNLKENCTKCPQGCDGTFCHLTSSCVSGCHDSYYGSNCKTCSGRCRHCNRITGRCDVCHDPYHGLDCEYSCEHCSTTDCVQACAPGLYGRACSRRCSKNCLPYPTASTNDTVTSNSFNSCISECHRYSGECINGCVDGWSGPRCPSQVPCGSNCMGCNATGACVEGCLPGYYGDDCEPCSWTCFNHTCHPTNGFCDNGCIHGQYGQFCNQACITCPGGACHPRSGICVEGSTTTVLVTGVSIACVLLIVGIVAVLLFICSRCRKTSSSERNDLGDESTHTHRSRQVEPLEYYALHRYWDIEDYDEVSQPLDQQQEPAEEDNFSDPALPVLADYLTGTLDTEDNNSDPELPVLADYLTGALDIEDNISNPTHPLLAEYLTGALDIEDNISNPAHPLLADYFPEALDTEGTTSDLVLSVFPDHLTGTLDTEDNNSDPAHPVLADNFPGALDTEDKGGDTSCSSPSGSQSYTHLVRDGFVDVPRTIVTYTSKSPTEDNT